MRPYVGSLLGRPFKGNPALPTVQEVQRILNVGPPLYGFLVVAPPEGQANAINSRMRRALHNGRPDASGPRGLCVKV